jgi:AP endonuclease-1
MPPKRPPTYNPSTPSKPNPKDTVTPPSAEPKSSPPDAPKTIGARGKDRLVNEPRSDSPTEPTRSAARRRAKAKSGQTGDGVIQTAGEESPSLKAEKGKGKAGAVAESEGESECEKDKKSGQLSKGPRKKLDSAVETSSGVGKQKDKGKNTGKTRVEKRVVKVNTQTIAAAEEEELDKSEFDSASEADESEEVAGSSKPKRKRAAEDTGSEPAKRKTKEEKEAEMQPLAARTTGLRMFVGAHVSMAKGVENSVTNGVHIGGNAFALFLKSQRQWASKPLEPENRDRFRRLCTEHGYDAASHVLPHGSYLVNLAQEEPAKAAQAYDAFLDDLHRCESLGIKLYNFHPGTSGTSTPAQAISRIAAALNKALSATSTVVPVLENMAGSGTVIGSTFASLAGVISQIKPEFKHRIGVCIDTCHSFAAGYDLRTPESFSAVLANFDSTVGMSYLKALHINDSKAPLGSHRDLHANIGTGFLGLRAFHNVMNEPRFENLPLILETPIDRPDPSDPKGKKTIEDKSVWAREIKLLESLIGMDAEGKEFKKLEKELSDKGKAERVKMQAQFEKKVEAEKKKGVKKEKGQRTLAWGNGGKGKNGKGDGDDEEGEKENGGCQH